MLGKLFIFTRIIYNFILLFMNRNDCGEFKLKLANLDREMKALKKDMKTKNEQCTKLDEEVRQLRSASNDEV